jgi:hypothetical protein
MVDLLYPTLTELHGESLMVDVIDITLKILSVDDVAVR